MKGVDKKLRPMLQFEDLASVRLCREKEHCQRSG